jgi:hypothetical protein
MKLSIDPGAKMGVALFHEGKPFLCKTIYSAKGITGMDRYIGQVNSLVTLIGYYEQELNTTLTHIAIERFEKHLPPKAQARRLWVLHEFCGYLMGALGHIYPDAQIQRTSKGKVPKQQAAWLAKTYGFQDAKEDALDALHIGILAGFTRNEKDKTC